ncbi:MAG TPA: ABC transporter ATP-binding protein, partial [Sedimentibacter sp.]|nr:ABC transporter ATP-binding protein [Sedimentibacter sp.]
MNISVENLNVNYCDKEILKDVSFQVKSGEVISIIGPNGSGKSTLIKALSRCLRPVKGNILFDKNNINTINTKEIARKLSVLPQEKNISLDISVEELVSYGRFPHLNFGGKLKKEDNDIISWAMEKTRLENMRKRLVHTLSGGERQRAWIAMSLAQKPQVMILDEPTTYLDISYQLEILELIKELNDTLGITVIMVLHDLNP